MTRPRLNWYRKTLVGNNSRVAVEVRPFRYQSRTWNQGGSRISERQLDCTLFAPFVLGLFGVLVVYPVCRRHNGWRTLLREVVWPYNCPPKPKLLWRHLLRRA